MVLVDYGAMQEIGSRYIPQQVCEKSLIFLKFLYRAMQIQIFALSNFLLFAAAAATVPCLVLLCFHSGKDDTAEHQDLAQATLLLLLEPLCCLIVEVRLPASSHLHRDHMRCSEV